MTKKNSTQSKAIVRKKRKKTVADLTELEKFSLLMDYKSGALDFGQLTDKYNLRSKQRVEEYIGKTIQELNIVKETNALNPSTLSPYTTYRPSNLINEPFLELLSPDEGELTEEEFSFAYRMVFIGTNKEAIVESGLDAGLRKYHSNESMAYANALKVRGLFLRNKKNIREKIEQLRKVKLGELAKDIDKDWVVNELVDQLERLKESGEHPKLILDTIDKIGKTCSAFTERVEVTDLSAAKKIDQLIEQAKKEVVPMLPAGTSDDGTVMYEVTE